MLDDARWGDDPRSRDDNARDISRGSRGGVDPREREQPDLRDVFVDRVSLPRGPERQHVRFRDRDYTLRGSESRMLASVGAFRVGPVHDLRDKFDQPLDPRHGELWHLRDSGPRRNSSTRSRYDGRHADQGGSRLARIEAARRGFARSTDVQPRCPETAGAEARRRGVPRLSRGSRPPARRGGRTSIASSWRMS